MDLKRRVHLAAVGITVGAVSFVGAGTALAQDDNDAYLAPTTTVAPEVLGVQEERAEVVPSADVVPAAEVAVAADAQVQGAALALTGGDALALALIGGAAVAGGAGLLAVRRRSTSS